MDRGSWHCTAGGDDQKHPQEKEMQKGKWLTKEALQIEEEWKAKEKRKDIPIWMPVPKNSKEI